jgi:sulfur carrier protein
VKITVNGTDREVPDAMTLPALIESLGLRPGNVVTERNGEALTPGEARATVLADGDRLEIVRAVAGG